mgnify:FL=1
MFTQAAKARDMNKPLAVGDRLDTDIAGGVAAGMPALHVLTGVSGPHALLQAPPEHRPTYIAADMRGLSESPESLSPRAQEGFEARIDGSAIVLTGGNANASSLAALRTALDVAWQQPDPPAEVRAESDTAEAALAEWW